MTPLAIGETIRERVDEINGELAGKEQDLAELNQSVTALKQERKTLEKILKDLDGNSRNGSTSSRSGATSAKVENADIIRVINGIGEGKSIDSRGVASALGVDPRNVARKLKKLVDDGEIMGNAQDGYSPTLA